MSEKRKSESTISAGLEEKKPKDSQSSIVHSSGATSTKTMTTPTSVIQNSPQTLLNTTTVPLSDWLERKKVPAIIRTNSPPGSQQPKMINSIKATPLQPGQPIPPDKTAFMFGGKTFCIPTQQYLRGRVIAQAQVMTPKLINPNGKQFLTSLADAKSDINGKNLKSDSKDNKLLKYLELTVIFLSHPQVILKSSPIQFDPI